MHAIAKAVFLRTDQIFERREAGEGEKGDGKGGGEGEE